jgi:cobalamin biosynthetic protein CobC
VAIPVEQQDIETHGGDLDRAAAVYGDPPGGWLDLSTGINPGAYPALEVSDGAWAQLPQPQALAELKSAAAAAYGAAGPELVACAPGTQALIQILPRVLGASRVTVLGPTYSEHAAAWRRSGAEVDEAGDLPPPDRSLVLVNPNNPDGRIVAVDELTAWADAAARAGQFLVVDEAFADVTPEISLVPAMPLGNVVILRSFGKFHGLAGLRLGFAVAAPGMVARLEAEQGPWAVSGPGLEIGARALADRNWAERERARLSDQMARLRAMLSRAGLTVVGGTDLFVLTEHGDAGALYGHLASRGILVRRFAEDARRLRFGLPGGKDAWARLQGALDTFAASDAVAERRHG